MRLDFSSQLGLKLLLCFAVGLSASAQTSKIISTVAGTGTAGNTGDGGLATSARINAPLNLVLDSAGNSYFADYGACVVRKIDTSGIISTVAGTGTCSISTDGGQAAVTALSQPSGVAIDSSNNLYIAEYNAARVRRVDSSGVISTFAGTGAPGSTGDGGAATSAQLTRPVGLVLDSAQNLYIADSGNNRIRMVSAGVISTVVGTGTPGGTGDGGLATAAQINVPYGVTLDTSGNLYVAELSGNRIRKVDTSGIITTIAGTGTPGYSGDGGLATSAQLRSSGTVAADTQGNIYIADSGNYRIRQVNSAGIITTIAGTGTIGFSGDGGPATSADIGLIYGLFVSNTGRLYLSDYASHAIRVLSASRVSQLPSTAVSAAAAATTLEFGLVSGLGNSVSLLYGSEFSVNGAGCTYTASPSFQASCPVTFTPLYPGLRWDALILKDSGGAVIGTQYLYGLGQGPMASVTPGAISTLSTGGIGAMSSEGAVFDSAGNMYFTDGPNNRIVKNASGTFSTLVITGATLSNPKGLASDGAGNLYVSDSGNNRVLMIASDGTATDLAIAGLSAPSGLAMNAARTLYIADTGNARILAYSLNGTTSPVTITPTLVSPTGLAFADDGTLYISDPGTPSVVKLTSAGVSSILTVTGAALASPSGLTTDRAGNLYVADSHNNVVYRIKADGTAAAVAGSGTAGNSGDGGAATSAAISSPKAVVLGPDGSLYFSDSGNGTLREVENSATVTFSDTTISSTSNQSVTFGNIGNSAIAFPASFDFAQSPSRFSLINSGGSDCSTFLSSSLAAATTCTMEGQFAPTAGGLVSDSLDLGGGIQITFNGTGVAASIPPSPSLNVASLNFGNETPGTSATPQTVTLTNNGSLALAISGVTLGGLNASDFTLTSNCAAMLAGSASCSIQVSFTPASPGIKSASVVFTYSGVSSQTVALTGIGTAAVPPTGGQASLSPSNLTFANQAPGTTAAPQTIRLTNTGGSALTLSGTVLNGADASDFALTSDCGTTISAGASCTVTITFTPSATGNKTAQVGLTFSDGSTTTTSSIPLLGISGTTTQTVPSGTITILNVNSGRALDIMDRSTLNGAPLQQYDYLGGSNQIWEAIPVDSTYYKIRNVGSGKVLDGAGAGTRNGTLVQQWNYLGGDNQKWQFIPQEDGSFEILNKASGKALDVVNVSTANNARIQLWSYNGTNNQKWHLTAVAVPEPAVLYYTISSLATGKVLDVLGASTKNQARIQQYDYLRSTNQQWQLVSTGDGYYQIVNRLSGKVLDATNAGTKDGTPVQQYTYLGGENQQWQLAPTSNGYYQIVNKLSGKCLDVTGMSSASGALLQIYTYLGGPNQQFELTPVLIP